MERFRENGARLNHPRRGNRIDYYYNNYYQQSCSQYYRRRTHNNNSNMTFRPTRGSPFSEIAMDENRMNNNNNNYPPPHPDRASHQAQSRQSYQQATKFQESSYPEQRHYNQGYRDSGYANENTMHYPSSQATSSGDDGYYQPTASSTTTTNTQGFWRPPRLPSPHFPPASSYNNSGPYRPRWQYPAHNHHRTTSSSWESPYEHFGYASSDNDLPLPPQEGTESRRYETTNITTTTYTANVSQQHQQHQQRQEQQRQEQQRQHEYQHQYEYRPAARGETPMSMVSTSGSSSGFYIRPDDEDYPSGGYGRRSRESALYHQREQQFSPSSISHEESPTQYASIGAAPSYESDYHYYHDQQSQQPQYERYSPVEQPQTPVGSNNTNNNTFRSSSSPPPPSTTSTMSTKKRSGGGSSRIVEAGQLVGALQPLDIVCGRGAPTNFHYGNQVFRDLVEEYQTSYLCAKRSDKPEIAMNVLDIVKERGGRFVRRKKTAGRFSWETIGDKGAYEKVCQALRDGAPDLRRHMVSATAIATSNGAGAGALGASKSSIKDDYDDDDDDDNDDEQQQQQHPISRSNNNRRITKVAQAKENSHRNIMPADTSAAAGEDEWEGQHYKKYSSY